MEIRVSGATKVSSLKQRFFEETGLNIRFYDPADNPPADDATIAQIQSQTPQLEPLTLSLTPQTTVGEIGQWFNQNFGIRAVPIAANGTRAANELTISQLANNTLITPTVTDSTDTATVTENPPFTENIPTPSLDNSDSSTVNIDTNNIANTGNNNSADELLGNLGNLLQKEFGGNSSAVVPPAAPADPNAIPQHLIEVFNRLIHETQYFKYVPDQDVDTDKEIGLLDSLSPQRAKLRQFLEKENLWDKVTEDMAIRLADLYSRLLQLDNRQAQYKTANFLTRESEYTPVKYLAEERTYYPQYIKIVGELLLRFPTSADIFDSMKKILASVKGENEKTAEFNFFRKALEKYPTSGALLRLYVQSRNKYTGFTEGQRQQILQISEILLKNIRQLTDCDALRRIAGMADFRTERSKSILAVIVAALDKLVSMGESNLAADAYQARLNLES